MNRRLRPRGFSLLELLVVIGLIALLGSLLIMGVTHMIVNGKRQQTRGAFTTCTAMYSDWDSITKKHFPSYKDNNLSNPVNVPCPQIVTADYFNTSIQNSSAATAESPDRQGYAVLFTRDVIAQFELRPATAASIGKMPANTIMAFQYPTGSSPYAPHLWQPSAPYNVLNRVQASDGNGNGLFDPNTGAAIGYVCIQPVPFTPINGGQPYYAPVTDTNYWFPAIIDPPTGQSTTTWNNSPVPVILDGWGNPIIFIPGGVLGYPPNSQAVSGTNNGMMTSGGIQGAVVTSPDGRPFWASAGPGGDFSMGDGNLYSFEK